MTIYMITGPTGKRYFGQTSRAIGKRWTEHKKHAKWGCKYHLHRAMRKYGAENFTIEPLIVVHNKADLDFYEQFAIDTFQTRNGHLGYNMAPGGRGGDRPECKTPEARAKKNAKLREITGEKHPCFRRDIDETVMKDLYLSGLTAVQVAERMSIPPCTAHRRLKRMGVIRSRDEQIKQITETMIRVRRERFWSSARKKQENS